MSSHRHPIRSALFTDLYELTMARVYGREDMNQQAVFELFFREMPAARNYMIVAGIDAALDALENLRFTDDELDYLAQQKEFAEAEEFLDRLRNFRFTGDVNAMAEGTPVFPNEPIVQVIAPILEAQVVETLILNQVHYGTVVASKAARVVDAAEGRNVVDFGSRRAHGADAALIAGRATYLAGGAGTSNVLAGKIYGVPIFGTMAHSFIQSHDSEQEAMEAFARTYPETTLLVDTYDTLEGVHKVIRMAEQWDEFRVRAVRLDSGDLAELAKQTRRMLNDAGLNDVSIFASSGLDEWKIRELLDAGAPIDGFGVGTKLVVSPDATDLDMAYKLVAYAGKPRTKLSTEKVILPGPKQVFRRIVDGELAGDVIARQDETQDGRALLKPTMRNGKRLDSSVRPIHDIRARCIRWRDELPSRLRALKPADDPYDVQPSQALAAELEKLQRELSESTSRPRPEE